MFPETLFSPGAKGIAGGLLELFTFSGETTTAFTTVTVVMPTLPADYVCVVHHINVLAVPGAAQTAVRWSVADVNQLLVARTIDGGDLGGTFAATQFSARRWAEYVLQPLHGLTFSGIFSAGANANTISAIVQGWRVPRGEIQFSGNF